MKKLIVILMLLIPMGLSAQTFKHFFGYMPKPTEMNLRADGSAFEWAFRPAVNVTCVQALWNKETKFFDVSALSAAGVGISIDHFKTVDGVLRSDYGFNLLYLFDVQLNGTVPFGSAVAATVSAFEIVSVGAGYNFSARAPVILLNATYNFNRPVN